MKFKIAIVVFAVLVVCCFGASSVFGQGGTGRATTPTTTKKNVTRKPASRTSRSRQSNSQTESESQSTEPQPSSSSSSPASSATPAPTPAPVEPTLPEPSLQDTFEWLAGKLGDQNFTVSIGLDRETNSGGTSNDFYLQMGKSTTSSFTMTGCTMRLEVVDAPETGTDGKQYTYKKWILLPFGDFDPASLKTGYRSISLVTTGSKSSVQTDQGTYSETGQFNRWHQQTGAMVIFYFESPENKDRAEKAVRRILKSCGGKTDPF